MRVPPHHLTEFLSGIWISEGSGAYYPSTQSAGQGNSWMSDSATRAGKLGISSLAGNPMRTLAAKRRCSQFAKNAKGWGTRRGTYKVSTERFARALRSIINNPKITIPLADNTTLLGSGTVLTVKLEKL